MITYEYECWKCSEWHRPEPAQDWRDYLYAKDMAGVATRVISGDLPSHNLPEDIRNLTITPKAFRQVAKELRANGTTALNLALALDLLAEHGI